MRLGHTTRLVGLLGGATVVLVVVALFASPDGEDSQDRQRTDRRAGAPVRLDRGPGELAGTRPSRRLEFRGKSGPACEGSLFETPEETAMTIICQPAPSGRIGLWIAREGGQAQFLGYPTMAREQLTVAVPLTSVPTIEAVLLTREDGPRGEKPGEAVLQAHLRSSG